MTEKLYQCVFVNDLWHCTQEQATPPIYRRGSNDGAWTICTLWGDFIRGFDKKRPTCKTCLKAVENDELTFPDAPKDDARPRKGKTSRAEEPENGSLLSTERTDSPGVDSGSGNASEAA